MRLNNKVIFMSGGGSEMASAMERRFLEEGAQLFLVDISEAACKKAIATLGDSAYESLEVFLADVTSLEAMEAAAAECAHHFGRIDAMVNCAGIVKHMSIEEMDEASWQAVLQINLTGTFHACKAVIPYMKRQRSGHILNISSLGGRTARNVGVNYAASKAGVVGLTMNLSCELAPFSITVNSLAPGPMRGQMFDTMEPERIRQLESGIPLGRVGTMDDVAKAAVYFVSDESSWVTGQVLDINGGIYCSG